MLEEFLADLEEMQKAKTSFHAGRAESEPALSRQLRARGINALILNRSIPVPSGSTAKSKEPHVNESKIEIVEGVVRVEVFG
jgi:hypothetical protein